MVKHIVLFKLKNEAPAEARLAAMNAFKAAIEALPAKIPFIRSIEVGLNINPAETWSIALYSEFDSLDDAMPSIPTTWPPESCWLRFARAVPASIMNYNDLLT